jgi:hypothetical protein
MGGWAVEQSPILNPTITLHRLRKRGYEALFDYCFKVAPALNESLYMGMSHSEIPDRSSRTYSVVRGAPFYLQVAGPPSISSWLPG